MNHKSGDSVYALKFNNIKVLMWSNDGEAGKRMGRIKVQAFECIFLFSFLEYSSPQAYKFWL